MNIQNQPDQLALDSTRLDQVSSLLPALGVILLGTSLVLFTAFVPISKVHNAAHDTRHAMVAPCH